MRPPRDREWKVKENPEQWEENQGSVGPRETKEERVIPHVSTGILSSEVMGSESGDLIQAQHSSGENRLKVGGRNRRPEPS